MINTARGITKGHIHVLFNERKDSGASDPAFKITVNTALSGSAADTFVLPLVSGLAYDCVIDWGDGNADTVTSSAIASKSHTYTTGGIYQISITGTFPQIYFNNTGDKAKLVSWDNVGDTSLSADQSNAFYGCGLTELPDDNLVFWNETLTDGVYMFRENSLTSLPSGMTLDSLEDGTLMFYNNSLTSVPSNMTLIALTNGTSMFRDNLLTSLPSGMTLDSLEDGYAMFYDNSLTSLPSGMTLDSLEDGYTMFYDNSLTSLPSGMTLDSLEDGTLMFYNNSLTSLPSNMTLIALTNGTSMFRDNSLTSLPSGMTLAALTAGQLIFLLNTINTTDYSNLLIRMEAANINTGVDFHGGNSKYNTAGAAARNALTSRDPAWVITDGGLEV